MSKGDLAAFYQSVRWHRARKMCMERNHFICQLCGRPAKIAHHIERLTSENYTDLDVSLNQDNLMAVCQKCHNQIHEADQARGRRSRATRDGLAFDKDGRLVKV